MKKCLCTLEGKFLSVIKIVYYVLYGHINHVFGVNYLILHKFMFANAGYDIIHAKDLHVKHKLINMFQVKIKLSYKKYIIYTDTNYKTRRHLSEYR